MTWIATGNDGKQFVVVAKDVHQAVINVSQLSGWRGGRVIALSNRFGEVVNDLVVTQRIKSCT